MYREVKRFHTILQLHSSGLLDTLHEEYLNPTIVLFGSAAQGLDDENSDIDLCIITEYKKEYMYQKKFEKKLGKELQLFIIKNISEISNKHLRSSIANGINLQGMIVWSLTSATKKGTYKEAQPNEERIISLLKIAAKKEQFVATTELSVNSSSILFVIAYESLREVMEAYCLQNRKLVLNHICLEKFIRKYCSCRSSQYSCSPFGRCTYTFLSSAEFCSLTHSVDAVVVFSANIAVVFDVDILLV
ncbi:MAG: nucleotidyltransferase domain-containing protein [Bacteroidota bacterium]|nr:nucleotidyltransferase domain-containing protein [Bacteroidota bacterium]